MELWVDVVVVVVVALPGYALRRLDDSPKCCFA
jgi:hypothetical protein